MRSCWQRGKASSPSSRRLAGAGSTASGIRAGLDFLANEPHVPEELLELPIDPDATLGSGTRQTREALTRAAVEKVLAVERRPALDGA